MDALPILEENTHDYTSTVPGKMHACGHDAHTTIALGVAKLLMAQRDQIKGRIKFVFQPAEEGGGGARAMIADGVLGDPRPDVSVGLHVWADMPVGVIGLTDGSMMAGASLFRVVLTGHGGHGAMPHLTIDPVPVAGLLISALNGVVGRKVDALSGAVLTVTSVRTSSEAYNVIPQSVELRGTFRTFEHEVAQQLEQRIREISTALASAHECRAEIEVNHLTIPVVNDAQVYQRVHKVFTGFGDAVQIQPVRTMASEDVSFLMDDIPGLYFFVGAGNAERGITYGHHHPRFDIDEDVLPLSVALLSSAVAEYILPEGRGGA
jgi:amidohydrolase